MEGKQSSSGHAFPERSILPSSTESLLHTRTLPAARQTMEEIPDTSVARERRSIMHIWIVEQSTSSVCLMVRGSKVSIVLLAAQVAVRRVEGRTNSPTN